MEALEIFANRDAFRARSPNATSISRRLSHRLFARGGNGAQIHRRHRVVVVVLCSLRRTYRAGRPQTSTGRLSCESSRSSPTLKPDAVSTPVLHSPTARYT